MELKILMMTKVKRLYTKKKINQLELLTVRQAIYGYIDD